MALIKKSELKELGVPQLETKLKDLKKEMMKFNAQRSTKTTLESPGRVKVVRKTIARIYTLMHQRKLQEKSSPKKEKPASLQPSKKKIKEVRKK